MGGIKSYEPHLDFYWSIAHKHITVSCCPISPLSSMSKWKVKTEPDPSHNQKINPWVILKPYAKFHPILYLTFWVVLVTYKLMKACQMDSCLNCSPPFQQVLLKSLTIQQTNAETWNDISLVEVKRWMPNYSYAFLLHLTLYWSQNPLIKPACSTLMSDMYLHPNRLSARQTMKRGAWVTDYMSID